MGPTDLFALLFLNDELFEKNVDGTIDEELQRRRHFPFLDNKIFL